VSPHLSLARPTRATLHNDPEASGVAVAIASFWQTSILQSVQFLVSRRFEVRIPSLDTCLFLSTLSEKATSITHNMGKKKVLVSYGVDIDAVAGKFAPLTFGLLN
jgi:hypothetical protein